MFVWLVIIINRSYRMCVIYLYNTTRRWLISVNKINFNCAEEFSQYLFTVCFWNTFSIHWYVWIFLIKLKTGKHWKIIKKTDVVSIKILQHNFQLNIQYFSMLKFRKRSAFYTFSAHQTFICLPINCINATLFCHVTMQLFFWYFFFSFWCT